MHACMHMHFLPEKMNHKYIYILQIDSVKKQGLLLEVVQVLTDLNLTILKGYISSDAGWFMDGNYSLFFCTTLLKLI